MTDKINAGKVPFEIRTVTVNDRMQQGYSYTLSEPAGENFHPEFRPELTPREMLAMGVFGGRYMTDCREEFPAEWFASAKLCATAHKAELNYFGINASKPLSYWAAKGWLHADDPRGWFQWYCRYYLGRRHPDDLRQIKRWKAMARHIAQVRKHCGREQLDCRRRQRQALLHWAYDSRRI